MTFPSPQALGTGRGRASLRFLRALGRNSKAVAGLSILAVFVLLALLAPIIFPEDPSRIGSGGASAPSGEHWLGTTAKGQDVLALTVWGSRSSLFVGFIAGTLATVVGIIIGLACAYFGKAVDDVLSLLTNVFLLLPGLPLLVILAAFMPPGLGTVIIVLVITGWAGSARVLRSQALSIRGKDYISAALVSGERPLRIMLREILPNMASIVMTTLLGSVIGAIGAQAGLEFLGLGDANTISWGTNLFWASTDGALMLGQWWIFAPSGLAIALVAYALAMCNYAVDEITNPRLRKPRRAASATAPTAVTEGATS
ncbi:ABC transporter permease [Zhihengliuella flava]|uniref:Peptide/nickel transport system permease protein n=1 Tax=Zhihengliuella flava TaxID=1285193 RepID=A0A931GFA9_9MICC|nr:ABC transporter permease [Zhihengliuella flava]MBG6085025.1 peptide/nickel transport system permease protein [Zhihengliuella flava]